MSDSLNRLRAALATRYDIQSEVAEGGMATVYLAIDLKHRRPVAVKVLRPDLASVVESRRFLREIEIAARLQHPHILPVFDSGEADGLLYYIMPYVEGESLRDRLEREKRLSLPETIQIARDVASALTYAHRRDVVHRDIKPANILLSGGHAVVADFGIARALRNAAERPLPDTLTQAGLAIGTPAYMSPEQILGESELDGRSDIYSLGCVVYEMLVGEVPLSGPEWLARRFTEAPPAVSRRRPDIPERVDAALTKALAVGPDDRWSSALEFVNAIATADAATSASGDRTAVAGAQGEAGAGVAVDAKPNGMPSKPARRLTVGRARERAAFHTALESVTAGGGLMLAIAGEPGIGKTTFVEGILSESAQSSQQFWISRGRCSERLAGADAYLPIFDALESVLRSEAVTGMMRELAPTWYHQVARLSADDLSDPRSLAKAQTAASQERLKRELSTFLAAASKVRPVIVFFDDVHWADISTVDVITYLAARFDSLRVLLVTAYRPSELLLSNHPFAAMKLDLQSRGLCREIPLPFLTREDVDHYLALECRPHRFPPELPELIHAKTEGSPLFMVDLLRYLRDRGMIALAHGYWVLVHAVGDIERDLPESVRSMVQRKIDQLSDADRRLLGVASVQGNEFDSAIVARVLQADPADVEERLEVLERVHAFVHRRREQELPDRTLTLRYRFVHAFYQNALYASLAPSRRATLSAAVARALLGSHGDKSAAIAAELAFLFESARDPVQSAMHFLQAARNAAKVFANQETIGLARRGLAMLAAVPESPERAQLELALQLTLGFPLMAVKGYAAPDTQEAFNRAYELSQHSGEQSGLFSALWGLWGSTLVQGAMPRNLELAGRLLQLAESAGDSILLTQAHLATGMTRSVFKAELQPALEHLDRGVALYDQQQGQALAIRFGHDPAVVCLSQSIWVLCLLGYPDQALERAERAITIAKSLSHPQSMAFATLFASLGHMLRREVHPARELADATLEVATEHGLVNWVGWGKFVRGWSFAEAGQVDEGLREIREGVAIHEAIAGFVGSQFLLMFAEALRRGGDIAGALAVVAEALAVSRRPQRTGNRGYVAELVRLRGELLIDCVTSGGRAAVVETDTSLPLDPEACFHEAIAIAKKQGAKSLELRAAMSLYRLHRDGPQRDASRRRLADIYAWFTEGFETRDLQDAERLLAERSRSER